MIRRLALASCTLLLASCTATTGGSPSSSAGEIDEMKRRIVELQQKAAIADVELSRLRQQVANLEARWMASVARVEDSAETPREALAEQDDIAPRQIEAIEESDIDLRTPASTAAATSSSASDSGAGPVRAHAPTEPISPAAQVVYDQGYTLFHQGRYLDAEASFQKFLQAYPNTELSDNAEYWIGESRFARGDFSGALAAFRETVLRYPDGNKVPDAMLKQADCLKGLGDIQGARTAYREVVRRYPDSVAAVSAAERLDSTR